MPTKNKTVKKVTRKFLENLAANIYNPAKKTFLRLCNGTLQNGPDPTNSKRPMHCGLGELYFAMTGHQPETDGVNELEVCALALKRSTLPSNEKAIAQVKALGLNKDLTDSILDTINCYDGATHVKSAKFYSIIENIPRSNDDDINSEVCSPADYRNRSKRVATQLRKAAALLPK